MKENLKLGAILLVITLVAGVLLGFTNNLTKEQIALNSRVSKDDLATIMPEADSIKETTYELEENVSEVYEAMKGSEQVGYVLKVTSKGFKGPIDFVIGISNDDTISGIKVLSHGETPGLGAKIEEDNFRNQYAGKATSQELETVKATPGNEYEIEAISGATVSSKATTTAINNAIRYYVEEIKGETITSNSGDKYPLETTDEKLFTLMPEATDFVELAGEFNSEVLKVFAANKDSEVIGHIIMTVEEGFNGDVVLLVGIDNSDILTGIEVVFQDETPNLGALVIEEDYRSQYVGKAISEEVAVDGISGATVTSTAAIDAVKNAIDCYLNAVKGKELEVKLEEGALSLSDERLTKLLFDATSIVEEKMELPKGVSRVYKGLNGEEITGYVIKVASEGFNGDVELLVGINNEDLLSGIEVVSQEETEGLGALVEGEEYRSQFVGKSVNEPLKVALGAAKAEDEIGAISGATVTSDASIVAVNNAMKFYVEKIKN